MPIWVQESSAPREIGKVWVQESTGPAQIGKIWVQESDGPKLIYTADEVLFPGSTDNWIIYKTSSGNVSVSNTEIHCSANGYTEGENGAGRGIYISPVLDLSQWNTITIEYGTCSTYDQYGTRGTIGVWLRDSSYTTCNIARYDSQGCFVRSTQPILQTIEQGASAKAAEISNQTVTYTLATEAKTTVRLWLVTYSGLGTEHLRIKSIVLQ